MAGVTNAAYRRLCYEQAVLDAPDAGIPGLFVCEMITSRGIVEHNPKTFSMLQFAKSEVRSVQLYGVDAKVMGEAIRILAGELGVRHVDINLGCPVPKVTRKGGGGALPWKLDRTAEVLREAAKAARHVDIALTVKTRIGIDDAHETYLDVGKIAQDVGCAAITLHGRTVAQSYSGDARWDVISNLAQALSISVIGNGDIWEAADAKRMIAQTGCAGVAIGRGCLGRPWLFRDLGMAFNDSLTRYLPTLGEVAQMVYRHAELLAELNGERWGLTDLRKHMAWYFKGFPLGGTLRQELALVSSLAQLQALLGQLDSSLPFPESEIGVPRGRQGSRRGKVALPHGWLDSRILGAGDISGAESDASGG
jgi:nifR3 family TIM-barrel protein